MNVQHRIRRSVYMAFYGLSLVGASIALSIGGTAGRHVRSRINPPTVHTFTLERIGPHG